MAIKNLPLEVDLHGRVGNIRLAPTDALNALYEAVVNSIHAVLDGPEPAKGRITIRILRGVSQLTTTGNRELGPVVGFEVQDNGVGFDEKNFNSFRRSDSTTKAKFGGKGVGRMLWLKVFRIVHVKSVFEDGETRWKRDFTFSTDGIGSPTRTETTDARGTTVTITQPVEHYRAALQHESETIAISTIEHCLEYFIADGTPRVSIVDPEAEYEKELGKLFQDELKSEIKRSDFAIGGSTFRITHLLVRGRKNSRHAINFCAHARRVKGEGLSGKIPGLAGGLRPPGSEDDLAYQGYVSGQLLDELVDANRATFDFDGSFFAHESSKAPELGVTYESLFDGAVAKARDFLEPTLRPILEANQTRIRGTIETTYPQYRHLLKHRLDAVAAIPPGVDGKELDIALYKIEQNLDVESREALNRELAEAKNPDESPDARRERLDKLLEKLNDSGMSKLARHVAYRRAVIEFLEDQIGLQTSGKYSLEEAVHAAVCPTKTSSEDIAAAKMNLCCSTTASIFIGIWRRICRSLRWRTQSHRRAKIVQIWRSFIGLWLSATPWIKSGPWCSSNLSVRFATTTKSVTQKRTRLRRSSSMLTR